MDPERPRPRREGGPAGLALQGLGVKPVTLGGRVDAGTLTGLVLVGIHARDRLVGGGHGGEDAAAAQRHTDPVGPAHGSSGQRHGHAQRTVDELVVGVDGGELRR